MIRTSLDRVDVQRPLKQLYGFSQATPKSAFIATGDDGNYTFDVDVFPGMVFAHVGGEQYNLIGETGTEDEVDLGLVGQFIGGDGIDEVRDEGIGAIAVWSLGSDAEFEVHSQSFVTDGTGAIGAGDEGSLLFGVESGDHQGKLCLTGGTTGSNGTTKAVAVLLEVISPTRIRIGGLKGSVA